MLYPNNPENRRIFYSQSELSGVVFGDAEEPEKNLGRKEDPSLALIMGAIYAGRRTELKTHTLEFYNSQLPILELFQSNLEAHFPESNPTIVNGLLPGKHHLNINSRPLARGFNFHTNNLRDLPWHLLETKNEKISFLRGLFTFAGSVNNSGVTLGIRLGKRSAVQIAKLLSEIGVTPLITEVQGYFRIVIGDAYGANQFLRLGLLLDKAKERNLQEYCLKKAGRVSIDPEKYYEFQRTWLSDPKRPIEQISREINVPATTLRYWQKGNAPREVTRDRHLKELVSECRLPDNKVLSFCYRNLNFPLPVALKFSEEFGLDQFSKILSLADGLGVDYREKPVSIYAVHENFKEFFKDLFDIRKREMSDGEKAEEYGRRARVVEWARENGSSANSFSTIMSSVIDRHIEQVKPLVRKLYFKLALSNYGLDLEGAMHIASITLFECLSRNYDPAVDKNFIKYACPAVRNRIYSEYARISGRGHKVYHVARAISGSKEEISVESVMKKFACTRSTAVHAISLARSNASSPEHNVDYSDFEKPYANFKQHRENDPAENAELSEFCLKIFDAAHGPLKSAIQMIYFDGMDLDQTAAKLNISKTKLDLLLKEFFQRTKEKFTTD